MVLGELSSTPLIAWQDGPGGYLAVASDIAAGRAGGQGVPALRPRDVEAAERWAHVLEEQFEGLRAPVSGERVVLAHGSEAAAPARVFAEFSGSRVIVCQTSEETLTEIAKVPEPSVVVVAEASELTVAWLMTVSEACASTQKTCGFLTGRGLPGLAFSVAKALLRPRADTGGVGVFDAPSHRQEENQKGAGDALTAGLTGRSVVKLIRSHGEGGHAKLPGTVVCGLLDDTEFPGSPDHGCRAEPRRCKRAGKSSVVFAHEIRAAVVAFVCCNGFNVARELYPSPVSMALGLAEGWAQALISPMRPLIAPDTMVAELLDLLRRGVPYGEVVRRMNELSALVGQPHAFVLHGDPSDRLETPVTDGRASEAAPVEPVGVDWVFEGLRQSERGARLLRSARAWFGEEAPESLTLLDRQLAKIEHSLLNALKWAESLPTGDSLRRLTLSRLLVTSAVGSWDRALSQLLLEGREIFDAYDLGHYDQRLTGLSPGRPCSRCGTPVETSVFSAGRGADDDRVAESCPICGPMSEGRRDGLRVGVAAATPEGSGGEAYSLTVRVAAASGGSVGRSVHLRLRFFDKAGGGCVADETRTVPAVDQDVEFAFTLPADLGVDLHSIRVVAACGFDMAYARARFVGRPPASGC
ncbi:hypothetical protein AB0B78_01090 [Streptomyces sp. NPDC040724]|uniref:hypothetical protein n=1 Tax=Streptomyces sp. NPDC040724 TaxID=3155612 RepID=UPI0033EC8D6E